MLMLCALTTGVRFSDPTKAQAVSWSVHLFFVNRMVDFLPISVVCSHTLVLHILRYTLYTHAHIYARVVYLYARTHTQMHIKHYTYAHAHTQTQTLTHYI